MSARNSTPAFAIGTVDRDVCRIKVFVVMDGDYDGDWIIAACSSRAKAEECRNNDRSRYIVETILDPISEAEVKVL